MSTLAHSREILKHGLIYSGSSILSKAVGFVMLPVYANYLRGEGYGIIGMVDVLISVIVLFVGFGISGALGRLYFEREGVQARNVLVSTTLLFMLLLVTAVSLPFILLNDFLSGIVFGKAGLGSYITLAVITFIFEMSSKTAEAYLMIRKRSLLLSSISLCRLVVGLSLNIYLIAYLKLGVLGYFYSGIAVASVFSVIMHLKVTAEVGLHFERGVVRELMGYSLPLLPGYLAMFVRNNADKILLRNYLGLVQLGVFEMLYKFATLMGVLIVEPFGKIWNVKRLELCDSREGPEVIANIFTFYAAILMFSGLVLSLEIPILLRLMTPREFWLGESLALMAVFSRLMDGLYHQFNFGLIYAKKTYLLSAIQIVSALLSLGFNWVLIARLGFKGAVLASCLVATVQGGLALYLSRDYYPVPYHYKKLSALVVVTWAVFLVLKDLSLAGTFAGGWLRESFFPRIGEFLTATLHVDAGGRLYRHLQSGIVLLADAALRLLLSLAFFPLAFCSGILPLREFRAALRDRFRGASPLPVGMQEGGDDAKG